MSTKYNNSPILEAICEIQFSPESSWDITIPGIIYEKVKPYFPKKQSANLLAIGLIEENEAVKPNLQNIERVQFWREDSTALIQVGPQLLAINHLRPYPTWQEFKPLIMQGLEAYKSSTDLKGINKVQLKYINRVDLALQKIELDDYFNFSPQIGDGLPKDFVSFIIGIKELLNDGRDSIQIELTHTNPASPETISLLLTIDYSLVIPASISIENISEWLEYAHIQIDKTFEASITSKLKDIIK